MSDKNNSELIEKIEPRNAIKENFDKRKILELQQKEKEMEFKLSSLLKEVEFYKGLVNKLTTYSD